MSKIKLIFLVVCISLIVISAFILFNNYSKNISSKIEQTESDKNVILTGDTKEFTIITSQFKFEPNKIEVDRGDKVRITAYSTDVPHGLALPEFEVFLYLEKNNQKTIEFIADKSGKFQYFCNTFCGEGHGNMNGELAVN